MTKVQGPRSIGRLAANREGPRLSNHDRGTYPALSDDAWKLRDGEEKLTCPSRNYDLLERTAKFGEAVIRFAKKIPQGPVNNRLIDQLVGCGSSVGANYWEADDAVSMKDFRNRVGTCRKEAKEAKFFIRMVAVADENLKSEARLLWQEAKELHLIFCKILHNTAGK